MKKSWYFGKVIYPCTTKMCNKDPSPTSLSQFMRVVKISLLFLILSCGKKGEKVIVPFQVVPKPLDVFLLLDQSSSMRQTDPNNNRIDASKFLVEYLATYWAKEQDHRIGLVNFGDLTPPNPDDEMVPLVSLDTTKKKEREELVNKIKPLDLRYTKFIEAFRKARRGFEEVEKDRPRQKAIVLLTDGEPDDLRRLSREAYFSEIIKFFSDSLQNCYLCVLGIDKEDKYWSKNDPYWRRIAKYTQRLISTEEKDLKEAFWKVISVLMEGVAEKWDSIPPEGLKIQLDPYLEVVTFTIHRELPHAEVSILNPKGLKIKEEPPMISKTLESPRTVIWKVEEPEVGIWICQIEKGAGKVEIGTMKVPVQPRLIYPKEVHPQGKPFTILASFLRRDGKPIKEHHAYKLKMWADLQYPGSPIFEHLDLIETPEIGIFLAKETIKTTLEGEYQIILNMKAHKIISETAIPVKVVRIPYIEVLKPKYEEVQPWHKDLIIEVEIRLGGENLNPTDYFIDNPNAIIFYQIEDLEKGKVIKSGHLRYLGGEKEARFSVNGGKIKKSGKYRLILNLRSRKKDGTIYEYTTNPNGVAVYRKMDLIDFLIYRFYILGAVILILLFLFHYLDIYIWNRHKFWILSCPKLTGSLEIIKEGEPPITLTLSGKRKVRVNSKGKLSFLKKGGDLIFFARREVNEEGLITEKGWVENKVTQVTLPLEGVEEIDVKNYKVKYNAY